MAKLSDKQKQFLEQPFVGVATTLREDGSPHATIVWVDVDDGVVSFNTETGRAKPAHLQKDPRASVLVVDPNDSHKWVSVDGPAEMSTDGADAQIDKLAKKYLDADEYPWRNPEQQRLKVRITPEHITAEGLDG